MGMPRVQRDNSGPMVKAPSPQKSPQSSWQGSPRSSMHGSQQGASFGVPRGQPPAEAVRSGSPTVRSRRTGEREAVPITPARGLEKRSKEKLEADVVDDEASSFGDGWFSNALSWVG